MSQKLTSERRADILACNHLPVREAARKCGVSTATVHKVRKTEAPEPIAPVASADEEALPDPASLPADMTVDQADKLLALADRAAARAEKEGNVSGLVAAGRLSATVLEHKRKAAPPPVVDVNAAPDMVAAAARFRTTVAALFERIVDDATKDQQ